MSKVKELAAMGRKELADRTYQRMVYTALCGLNKAVWEANRNGTDIGVIAELDIQHLIREIKRLGSIQYTSNDEGILARIIAKNEIEVVPAVSVEMTRVDTDFMP